MAAHTQDITITAADGRRLAAVVATPEGAGPWPGVVVLHELFGVDDQMRVQLRQLAGMGYLAVMPNLYTEGGMRKCLIGTLKSLRSGRGRAYDDIEAARRYLLAAENCTGAVGVLGCCMGGGFALMTAASGFSVASVNYGDLPRDMDISLRDACPIIGNYGGRDVTKKGAAQKLDAALTRLNVPHDIKEYPDAGHVFMNEELNGWPWLRPIVRVLHFGPDPVAAADAWSRIRVFFDEHLLDPTPELG